MNCDCDDKDDEIQDMKMCEICLFTPAEIGDITCKDCFYDEQGNPCLHGI